MAREKPSPSPTPPPAPGSERKVKPDTLILAGASLAGVLLLIVLSRRSGSSASSSAAPGDGTVAYAPSGYGGYPGQDFASAPPPNGQPSQSTPAGSAPPPPAGAGSFDTVRQAVDYTYAPGFTDKSLPGVAYFNTADSSGSTLAGYVPFGSQVQILGAAVMGGQGRSYQPALVNGKLEYLYQGDLTPTGPAIGAGYHPRAA